MSKAFFIFGCPRSGTTAFARIFNTATNAEVYSEQAPNLCIESRLQIEGHLSDPETVLKSAREQKMQSIWSLGHIYGDKNPCYMPFIPLLSKLWDCKFVWLVRDGREVVNSNMEWHMYRHPIYCMSEDDFDSTISDPREVPWDYSRIRPSPDQALFKEWKRLSIFAKLSWHWAEYNRRASDFLSRIDDSRWIRIDVSKKRPSDIASAFEFLELQGYNKNATEQLMNLGINKLKNSSREPHCFSSPSHWGPKERDLFERYSGEEMHRLGMWG